VGEPTSTTTSIRLCVRGAFCSPVFPGLGLFPSTASFAGQPASISIRPYLGTITPADSLGPLAIVRSTL